MLGKRIKNYLKEKGISQTFIANGTGIKKGKLNQILNGRQHLKAEEYLSICEVLNITADHFNEGGK